MEYTSDNKGKENVRCRKWRKRTPWPWRRPKTRRVKPAAIYQSRGVVRFNGYILYKEVCITQVIVYVPQYLCTSFGGGCFEFWKLGAENAEELWLIVCAVNAGRLRRRRIRRWNNSGLCVTTFPHCDR